MTDADRAAESGRGEATKAYYAWLDDADAFHEDLHDGFKAGYAAGANWERGRWVEAVKALLENHDCPPGDQMRRDWAALEALVKENDDGLA